MDATAVLQSQKTRVCDTREDFLAALREDIHVPEPDRSRLIGDFSALLDYYQTQGLSEKQALSRVGSRPLAGFYHLTGMTERYHNLFTDAYFPLSETMFNQNVWRSAARLREPVVPCVLQAALDIVLTQFPYFSTTLRRGPFWFDLWGIRRRQTVRPQRSRPGAPIRPLRCRTLFLVEYLEDEIVVEGRHALADGNGCVLFTRALTREYLRLLGKPLPPAVPSGITCSAHSFPSFQDVYETPKHDTLPPSLKATQARHLAGKPTLLQPAGYAAIRLNTTQLTGLAKHHGVTVTALLSAVILRCIKDHLDPRERRGRVKLAVPVNLHQYYPLDTLRNYSMYLNLELEPGQLKDLDSLIPEAARQLAEQNTKENVGAMIGGFLQKANNPVVRRLPAFIKWAALSAVRILYWERRTMTAIFSNLGVVPEEFGGNLDTFGVAISPVKPIRRKLVLTTLADTSLLSITKSTLDNGFEQTLVSQLNRLGLDAELTDV